jgi:hypothetical protein
VLFFLFVNNNNNNTEKCRIVKKKPEPSDNNYKLHISSSFSRAKTSILDTILKITIKFMK